MTRVTPEDWLGAVPLVELHVWVPPRAGREGCWVAARAVKDHEFLDQLVVRAIRNHRGTHAVHDWHGRWRLVTLTPARQNCWFRYYDTREAAEMVAMHDVRN